MVGSIVQVIAALALLYFGGEWLVRGASALAARWGVSPLAIGLTVVAFGTSAPELVVSLDAALSGANDIAVGNVVGSNIANLGLILGLAVLLCPAVVQSKIVRFDAPLMIAASFALLLILADGTASRAEGGLLVAALAAYVVFTFWEAGREAPEVREELASAAPEPAEGAWRGGLVAFAGFALLVAGGHVLVRAAVDLASSLGVGQAAIGLTVVAIGTSVPELATTVVASVRGQGDIAIGNVVGSNLFNILGILGITALVDPLAIGNITWIDLGTMIGFACVVMGLIVARRRLGRIEGGVLLAAFALYFARLLVA